MSERGFDVRNIKTRENEEVSGMADGFRVNGVVRYKLEAVPG
jgi:hypothetical protein